jgi:hypothetical protein
MDEKGFMKGIGDDAKVIVPRSNLKAISCQPGNHEWVTVIESIGTNNYVVPPFVIFKGKIIQQSWVDAATDPQMAIAVGENGWTDQELAVKWLKHFDKYTADLTQEMSRLLILDGHSSHTSLEFIQYCEYHQIIPLCLPPHATHLLQPLDVSIFGPLGHQYKKLVRENSLFGAQNVTNEQFLIFFQQARQTIGPNIPSSWRRTGLKPFLPSIVIQLIRPKTPPKASFTDENGVTVNITAPSPSVATKINDMVAQLTSQLGTPAQSSISFLHKTCLAAIAEANTLGQLNEALVQKAKDIRQKKSRKGIGEARVLTVAEIVEKRDAKDKAIEAATAAKARRDALYGKGKFAQLVWKEYKMDTNVFE